MSKETVAQLDARQRGGQVHGEQDDLGTPGTRPIGGTPEPAQQRAGQHDPAKGVTHEEYRAIGQVPEQPAGVKLQRAAGASLFPRCVFVDVQAVVLEQRADVDIGGAVDQERQHEEHAGQQPSCSERQQSPQSRA